MEHDEYSRPPFVFCSAADAKEKSPPLTINGNARADFTEFNLSGKSFSCEHQKLFFPFLILPGRRRRRFRSLLEPAVMNFKGTISLSIARINVVCSITQSSPFAMKMTIRIGSLEGFFPHREMPCRSDSFESEF